MRRIVVVGPPCSGKSTTAKALAACLGVPHVELDSLWWEANWVESGAELFRKRAADVVAAPTWVVDGNYFAVGATEVIYPAADTIVWLNYSRWVTVPRALRRTVRRALFRTALWSGNRERLQHALRPVKLIAMAWRSHPEYNRRLEQIVGDPSTSHLDWVRLRTPRAARRWLSSIMPWSDHDGSAVP